MIELKKLEEFKISIDQTEERIIELKDRSFEIIQSGIKRKKNEKSLRDLCCTVK